MAMVTAVPRLRRGQAALGQPLAEGPLVGAGGEDGRRQAPPRRRDKEVLAPEGEVHVEHPRPHRLGQRQASV